MGDYVVLHLKTVKIHDDKMEHMVLNWILVQTNLLLKEKKFLKDIQGNWTTH